MKLTATIYKTKSAEKSKIYRALQSREITAAEHLALTEKHAELKAWFESLPTVSVSFMIGYRLYYRNVVQIGKSFYDRGEKMTKSNGYRAIEIIPAITEKMKADMISDSYYY